MNGLKIKITKAYLYSAGTILIATALAKLVSSFGSARLLHNTDPVLHISNQVLFWFAALIELTVAGTCFLSKRIIFSSAAVAWLSTMFLFYRKILSSYGEPHVCPCMGRLTDALHISPETAGSIMTILFYYLLIGSYASLLTIWLKPERLIRLPSPAQ